MSPPSLPSGVSREKREVTTHHKGSPLCPSSSSSSSSPHQYFTNHSILLLAFPVESLMRTINMGRSTSRDSSSSSSSSARKHFQWRIKKSPKEGAAERKEWDDQDEEKATLSSFTSSSYPYQEETAAVATGPKKKTSSAAETAVSRLRSVLAAATSLRRNRPTGLGARVTGTLYGHRRGHVHLAFQADSKSCPVVLVELATATSALVREMASGLVRIALECERKPSSSSGGGGGEKTAATTTTRLVEEPLWRAYINGKKCGYAVQRECGPGDWKVLRAVEPVSMGAGVIPGDGGDAGNTDKDVMYMRAKFERVVGSKDSEAFYMMNPDNNGGPELSVYLLRV
ncbi:protein MIZU-KUSSEI 1-like [Musa acuminata AAA Group]|uniref:protein MIZU-KUSSEI 1-like n=1 Tax=Musa acuminata AAA Group TaxID=214697 RepID=UPI0031CFB9EA